MTVIHMWDIWHGSLKMSFVTMPAEREGEVESGQNTRPLQRNRQAKSICLYIYTRPGIVRRNPYVCTYILAEESSGYSRKQSDSFICVLLLMTASRVWNDMTHLHVWHSVASMGWLRLVGSLKLYVSFAEYRLCYRSLVQKRLIILRSLLLAATLYPIVRILALRSGIVRRNLYLYSPGNNQDTRENTYIYIFIYIYTYIYIYVYIYRYLSEYSETVWEISSESQCDMTLCYSHVWHMMWLIHMTNAFTLAASLRTYSHA